MDDEDDDVHICLVCQSTVLGLINYVNHKKLDCPGRKNANKEMGDSKQEETTQPYMQIISSPNSQYSQSLMFPAQLDTTAISSSNPTLTSQSVYSNNLLSVGTSPSHGLNYCTQISFSDEIGPIMSLRPSSEYPSPTTSRISTENKSVASLSGPSLTSHTSSPSSCSTVVVDVPDQYLTIQPGSFSPPSNVIDPNFVMNSERSDFFSSLALQKKGDKEVTESNDNKDSLTADLPISNILNSLDLYGDDLDFDFSDEDFLQDAFSEESDNDSIPPPNYTHGKWKPGEGPSHSKVVWQPGKRPMPFSRGKWRPGEMPGKARGKLKSHILAREKEIAKEAEERSKVKRDCYECQYCQITFNNRFKYSSHCMQKEHKNNVSNYRKTKESAKNNDREIDTLGLSDAKKIKLEDEKIEEVETKSEEKTLSSQDEQSQEENNKDVAKKQVKDPSLYICTICEKKFSSKYKLAKHLLSTYHKNRILGNNDTFKVLEQYHKYIVWLSPYQCTICQFYFNRHNDFMQHLVSEQHQLKCESVNGEILCSICKFSCHDNTELLQHLENNGIHKISGKKGCKPCIIKEKNYESKCKICLKKLHSKLHMRRHMRSQHFQEYEKYELSCDLCNKTFFDSYTYKKHMTTGQHRLRSEQKKKFGKVDAERDDDVFNEGVLRTRVNRKIDKPYKLAKKVVKGLNKSYKCEYCDFVATHYDALRPHYMACHANHIFVCELCDLTFITEKARKVHYTGVKHQANLKKSEGSSSANILQCEYCERRFEDERLKIFHMDVYHLHPNSEETLRDRLGREDVTTVKYSEFLESLDNMDEGKIQCIECPKKIMKDYVLEHLRSHSGDKPFKCRYCSAGFASPLSLRRHLMSHAGLAEKKCEICGKEFKKYGSYKEHMKKHCLEENNASKLVCDMCGVQFYLEKQLRAHMKRHGEKQFKCDYPDCRWAFHFFNELKAHQRSHTGEKTHLCDVCGYAAGTKNRLNRHRHTHTGERAFHCEYCNYKAGTRTHLRRHMRIHIGSKPYKCPYCDYSCNTHENIRKHISKTKKHLGLPIYPCKLCSYGTNSTVEFRFHIEQNHSGEFNFKASDGLAIISGLYKKEADPDKPLEGTEIFQVKERKVRTDRNHLQGKRGNQNVKNEYNGPETKQENVMYTEHDIPQKTKLAIDEFQVKDYQQNQIEGQYAAEIIDVQVTHRPNYSTMTYTKVTPIVSDVQTYGTHVDTTYSGQMSSVGYFMPVTATTEGVTVESTMIPQPPALQVDVVANPVKWPYE